MNSNSASYVFVCWQQTGVHGELLDALGFEVLERGFGPVMVSSHFDVIDAILNFIVEIHRCRFAYDKCKNDNHCPGAYHGFWLFSCH